MNKVSKTLLVVLTLANFGHLHAQETSSNPTLEKANYTERSAYFGDLHLHTGLSFDAAASGTITTLDDAYRYALGQRVEYMGRPAQRQRPLDFLAITDHSEYLGIALEAADPAGLFANTHWPQTIAEVSDNTLAHMQIFSASGFRGTAPAVEEFSTETLIKNNWQRVIEAAERYNQPNKFTAFVAFEWSPMPEGGHIHRNVIFQGPDYPERTFSALDSQRPEDLWTYAETLRAQEIDSILIPHNSNLSKGMMFSSSDSYGEPITSEYAQRRLRNERLVEIAQIKGTSETRPEIGAPDEFSHYEIIDLASEEGSDPAGGYIRPALARGLEIQEKTGVNPFTFGLIGSSDFHSGLSSTEEDNFPGALGEADNMGNPEAVLNQINSITGSPSAIFSAGAMTGLWAESNTRESLFDAMNRREAFATSGTRIRVRLFAGWNFSSDLMARSSWVQEAYEKGFPMGSDIPGGEEDYSALQFIVQALKDPEGANLDRVQIIKIWLEGGVAQEKIFDVSWSEERMMDDDGLIGVGNTVNLNNATYTNDIGAAQLATIWTDPEFDPATPAIYYARVLEIPTPRWSTYLAVRNNLPLSTAVPATIQERAWTSPVFYHP